MSPEDGNTEDLEHLTVELADGIQDVDQLALVCQVLLDRLWETSDKKYGTLVQIAGTLDQVSESFRFVYIDEVASD